MYRSLLIHLDPLDEAGTALDQAVRLARSLDCHLVGLAPTGRLPLRPGLLGADEALALAMEGLHQRAAMRAQRFEERCRAEGLPSFEAVVDDEEPARSIVRHAHCSDLVIIGQARQPGDGATVEQVVLQCARPALLVPAVGHFDTLGENVLVSWNDSPEAARALADAMPLLCQARQVHVLQYEEPLEEATDAMRKRLEAVRQWLAWHGVEATVQIASTEIDIGNALLSRAAETGVDLLVMGAYGHSRWSERILGGTTRTLLQSMTLPVLMSH